MKVDIETLKDTFKIGYEAFEESREEAEEAWELYHNRHWTSAQLSKLQNRGQPAETFNVVKMFARMLLGYYSTVINTIKVKAEKESEITTASLLNDISKYLHRVNNMDALGDKIKLSAIISGLMVAYIDVEDLDEKDRFGRPLRNVNVGYVPDAEIVLDPMSRQDDYSDARYIHRFKWVAEETITELFGETALTELVAYFNHLNIDEAEFEYAYNGQFQGQYRRFNNYLLVHSVMQDDSGKVYSVFWCGDKILEKEEITYKEVRFPYRVHRLHTSDKTEYYGLFREVVETQKAINQALIKIQLMVNSQKAYVEDGAVENIDEFTDAFNRVTSVIPVQDLAGIKIDDLSKEVLDQYTVIDKALDRIQRVLSINDSFLGMAYASDSGRKVKLQQNATVIAMRYMTTRIEQFYRLLGWDQLHLVKQYFTAEQAIRIADDY